MFIVGLSIIAKIRAVRWMNLENIISDERGLTQKPHIVGFYLFEMYRIGKFTDLIEHTLVAARAWGKWDTKWLRTGVG